MGYKSVGGGRRVAGSDEGMRRGWKRDEGGKAEKNKRLFFHSPPLSSIPAFTLPTNATSTRTCAWSEYYMSSKGVVVKEGEQFGILDFIRLTPITDSQRSKWNASKLPSACPFENPQFKNICTPFLAVTVAISMLVDHLFSV